MAAHRVVILSPQGRSLCPSLGMMLPNVDCEFVTSGYEAAAELLALSEATTRALVIDFQALNDHHLPLLNIAREQGVELMGVGAFPPGLSSEHLSGMRLLGVKDLPKAIESLDLSPPAAPSAGSDVQLTPKGQDAQFAPEAAQEQEGKVL